MSDHRVLLVEDSREVQLIVSAALKGTYVFKAVSTAQEAFNELESKSYSLVILDVELPDGDGFKICAQMKTIEKNKDAQIVFLSGKQSTSDKVMGLSLGGDDYIVKPVDPVELKARIDARIRRLDQSSQAQENFFVGPFKIVSTQQKIYLATDGQEKSLDLPTMEFKLLHFLLRHENQVLSREQILSAIWGHLPNVTDRTVDTHIYNIRKKLGTHASCIQSIPRVGYRFSNGDIQKVA